MSRAVVTVAAVVLGTAAAASAVSVSLPTDAVIASVGDTTVVTMSIGNVTDLQAVAISFTFDDAIVAIPSVASVQLGSVVSTCNPHINLNIPGRVNIALACAIPVTGSGSLLSITFEGVASGMSALTFSATPEIPDGCQLNEGTPSCEPGNGLIRVGPQPTATRKHPADGDCAVTSPDVSGAFASLLWLLPPALLLWRRRRAG